MTTDKLTDEQLKRFRDDWLGAADKRVATLFTELLSLRAERCPSALLHGLAHQLIERILAAEANCDPLLDVDLRLASIIAERDRLRAGVAHAKGLRDEWRRNEGTASSAYKHEAADLILQRFEQTDKLAEPFEVMNAPDYPATCDNCGEEGTNASMEQHMCERYEDLLNFPCCLGEHDTCRGSQPAIKCPCMCHD